jgi:hypothetical protein
MCHHEIPVFPTLSKLAMDIIVRRFQRDTSKNLTEGLMGAPETDRTFLSYRRKRMPWFGNQLNVLRTGPLNKSFLLNPSPGLSIHHQASAVNRTRTGLN